MRRKGGRPGLPSPQQWSSSPLLPFSVTRTKDDHGLWGRVVTARAL